MTYSFATGLLQANRQIHREASSIFYAENPFVVVRSHHLNIIEARLKEKLPAVAVTSKAGLCSSMTAIVDFENLTS